MNKGKVIIKYLLLLVFLVAVFSYAMFQGGFVSWFLFYSIVTVIVSTILVALYPFQILRVERDVHKDVLPSGDTLIVTVTLHKRAIQPFFYVRVQDLIPSSLGTYEECGALFFFSFQRKLVFSYEIRDVKRGTYKFESLSLVFGDLFGLFERKKVVPCETKVFVYPHVHQLSTLPVQGIPKNVDGTIQRSFEEDRSLAGVRQYVPGDRLTSIDWKQSARSSKLMTKEFESYHGEGIVLAVDTAIGDRNEQMFEHSIELAASLMVKFAEKHPGLKVAVKYQDWYLVEVTRQTISKGLMALAQVEPRVEATPVIHKMYREWTGMQVYYVSSQINGQLLAICRTLIEQKVMVTVCVVAVSEQDRHVLMELEKIGIAVFVENE
ncbi:DUF58 domain-containing protein [Alkalihalobacillus sp. MEB130]|uniref:DUF58 domain-containing protein n=1 Tax=Alkalihalobacillus sp. MEB130 TaxID=2976704 RepID=UPI0028DFD671|nr:DUF58 domain-containing protein [Alkalihalobacillus sp. MEB130]MDT8862448.1 DUF58 domain-containing protein [Alkalihalobacillus sp. MEB130]